MNVYAPLPSPADSPPAPAGRPLFSPNQLAAGALLGGVLAGLGLHAWNLQRQGRGRDAMLAVAAAWAGALLIVASSPFVSNSLVYGANIGLAVALRRGALAAWERDKPARRSWWACVGVSVAGGLVALVVNGLWQSFAPDVALRQVTLPSGDIVEYRGGASSEQAAREGQVLVDAGLLVGEGANVQLEKLGPGYGLGVYLRPAELDPGFAESMQGVLYDIGEQATGGAPVRLRTCDIFLGKCRDWY